MDITITVTTTVENAIACSCRLPRKSFVRPEISKRDETVRVEFSLRIRSSLEESQGAFTLRQKRASAPWPILRCAVEFLNSNGFCPCYASGVHAVARHILSHNFSWLRCFLHRSQLFIWCTSYGEDEDGAGEPKVRWCRFVSWVLY